MGLNQILYPFSCSSEAESEKAKKIKVKIVSEMIRETLKAGCEGKIRTVFYFFIFAFLQKININERL